MFVSFIIKPFCSCSLFLSPYYPSYVGSISCKNRNLLLWLQFIHFILCSFPNCLMHLFIVWQKFLLKKPSAINLRKWSIFLIRSAAGADGNAAHAWVLGFWVLSSLCHPRVTQCARQQDKPSRAALRGRVGSQQVWRAEQRASGGLCGRRVAKAASQLHPGQRAPLKLFCFVKPSGPNLLFFSLMCGSAAGMIQVTIKYFVSRFQNLIWAWLRASYFVDSCIFLGRNGWMKREGHIAAGTTCPCSSLFSLCSR